MQLVSDARREQLSAAKDRVNWSLVKRVLTGLFFLLVVYLLVTKAATIDWRKVYTTFKETSPSKLAVGFGLGVLCYSFYASYDLLGRYLLKLKTPAFATWLGAWISYACNLNLGALVGSVAFRYRLYSRLGVPSSDVTRVLGISVTTNWLTYVMLAGALFVSGTVEPPAGWFISKTALQLMGAAFLLVVAVYLYMSAFSKKREFSVREHNITLPSLRIALLQLALSTAHWSLMAAVMYQFFPSEIGFFTVYAVLLVSCVAGALSHIPGGLGVLEAVFVAFLAGRMEQYEIIAAVFAYRCVFYFAPLALALPTYLGFEAYYRRRTPKQPQEA